MAVARSLWGYIERRDQRLMRRMNRWHAPRWFRMWMIAATRMCDGWIWYGLGFMPLVFGGPQRVSAVLAAGSAAIVGILVFKALKKLSQRPRPCQLEPHCWSKVLPPDQFSFPSGHTMTAFSIALVVGYFYPALQGALFFLALSIAVSHRAWHAFPQRRSCRRSTWRGAGLRFHYCFRVDGTRVARKDGRRQHSVASPAMIPYIGFG
jgi:undecaprenyl-diphosphatase